MGGGQKEEAERGGDLGVEEEGLVTGGEAGGGHCGGSVAGQGISSKMMVTSVEDLG